MLQPPPLAVPVPLVPMLPEFFELPELDPFPLEPELWVSGATSGLVCTGGRGVGFV
jgi:hypothetical protein